MVDIVIKIQITGREEPLGRIVRRTRTSWARCPEAAAVDRFALNQLGFDGEQAWEMLQSENFDLLLLDLGLPIKDGWTILKELRTQEYKLPIIVVSANDFCQDGTERTDYIAKPFRFQDLLKRVRFHLQSAESELTQSH